MRNVSLSLTVLAALVLLLPGQGQADPEDSVARAPKKTRPSVVAPAGGAASPLVGSSTAQRIAQQPQQKVRVRQIKITGATVFPEKVLHDLVASGEGQELALADIEQLATRITAYYRRRGYLVARAYLPPQQIQDGTVEIAVLEGKVGKVEVQGAKHYNPERLKAYVAPPKDKPVFNARELESGMLRLNDLPGLKVESTLKPGAGAGTTDILINVMKDRLISGSLELNDYGSRLTGRWRYGASVEVNSPTGLGDVFSLRGVASEDIKDTWFARAAYTLPVNTLGTKIGAAYTHAESVVTREFTSLGISGTGDLISGFVAHPLIRSQTGNLFGQVGYDYKDFQTRLLHARASEDTLSVVSGGLSGDVVDGWRGLTTATVFFHRGLPGILGSLEAPKDKRASRAGAGGEFTKFVGSASRLQQVYGPVSIFGRVSGQWSDDLLVSPEQFIVGGAGIVRGYPIGELAGDKGFTFTGEVRWNAPGFADRAAWGGKTWGDLVQIYGFWDHGEITVVHPLPSQKRHDDLSSAGAGIRIG